MNDDFISEFFQANGRCLKTPVFSHIALLSMIGNSESIPNHSFPKHKIKSSLMICFKYLSSSTFGKNINQHSTGQQFILLRHQIGLLRNIVILFAYFSPEQRDELSLIVSVSVLFPTAFDQKFLTQGQHITIQRTFAMLRCSVSSTKRYFLE